MPQPFGSLGIRRLARVLATAAVLVAGSTAPPAAASAGTSGRGHASEATPADSYVLSIAGSMTSTNISIDEYSRVRAKRNGDFLWFRRAGKSSVIEDPATLEEARALFFPLRALEPEQEDLRRRQESLEEKEQALDREEEAMDRLVDRMDHADGEDADTEDAAPAGDAEREEFHGELEELRTQQEELQARHRELEARNRELEAVEHSLDAREDTIEKEAEGKLWNLIDAAVKKGLSRHSPRP
ncbi:MAG: hypothetical protein ABI968_04195 [Acidobacteriota bacterium]